MSDKKPYDERPKYEPNPEQPETYNTTIPPQNNSADHDQMHITLSNLKD